MRRRSEQDTREFSRPSVGYIKENQVENTPLELVQAARADDQHGRLVVIDDV